MQNDTEGEKLSAELWEQTCMFLQEKAVLEGIIILRLVNKDTLTWFLSFDYTLAFAFIARHKTNHIFSFML